MISLRWIHVASNSFACDSLSCFVIRLGFHGELTTTPLLTIVSILPCFVFRLTKFGHAEQQQRTPLLVFHYCVSWSDFVGFMLLATLGFTHPGYCSSNSSIFSSGNHHHHWNKKNNHVWHQKQWWWCCCSSTSSLLAAAVVLFFGCSFRDAWSYKFSNSADLQIGFYRIP